MNEKSDTARGQAASQYTLKYCNRLIPAPDRLEFLVNLLWVGHPQVEFEDEGTGTPRLIQELRDLGWSVPLNDEKYCLSGGDREGLTLYLNLRLRELESLRLEVEDLAEELSSRAVRAARGEAMGAIDVRQRLEAAAAKCRRLTEGRL